MHVSWFPVKTRATKDTITFQKKKKDYNQEWMPALLNEQNYVLQQVIITAIVTVSPCWNLALTNTAAN